MTAPDRDPTALAREVLAAVKVMDAAPDLARAVLNVKKLADDYVALASQCMTDGDVADAIDWENAASLILAALNGDNK